MRTVSTIAHCYSARHLMGGRHYTAVAAGSQDGIVHTKSSPAELVICTTLAVGRSPHS